MEQSVEDNYSKNQFRSGVMFAIAGTALFSLKSIFAKLAFLEGIDATTLVTLRMIIAFPFYVLIFIYAVKTRPQKAALLTKSDSYKIFGLGFLGYYLASYLDFQGLFYISAQLERLTLFTYPIMVALLSWLFFREKMTTRIVASLAISYAGVSLLFFNEAPTADMTQNQITIGTTLVALAALSFAVYLIFSKAFVSRLGSLIFTSLAMSSSMVFIVIQFFITHDLKDLNVSSKVWFLCFLLAVFSTVIPSFFTSEAVNRIGATKTSIMGSLGPVMTIVLAVNLLGEDFGLPQVGGLILVVFGVSLLRKK